MEQSFKIAWISQNVCKDIQFDLLITVRTVNIPTGSCILSSGIYFTACNKVN